MSQPDERRGLVRSQVEHTWADYAKAAGVTWEWLSSWLPGGMDAEAWEAVIPQMGYMARLRNLRNFDEAKISDGVRDEVVSYLKDPMNVAASRQFPIRFYNAWNAVRGLEWALPLERALDFSVQNVPELDGNTLVMVDVSGPSVPRYSLVSSDVIAMDNKKFASFSKIRNEPPFL